MRKIFVDLDGVLADFYGFAKNYCGVDYSEDPKLAWSKLDQVDRLFQQLPTMPNAWQFFNEVLKLGEEKLGLHSVEILTALPLRTGKLLSCAHDKTVWVNSKINSRVVVNCVDDWTKKKYYCQPGDILIDDTLRNCHDWDSKNGISLLHTSQEQTLNNLRILLND